MTVNVVEFLKKMPSVFMAEAAAGVDCIVQYNCSTPAYVTIKNSTCVVAEGESSDPADITITMDDEDLIGLLTGELNGMTAFMTGKLKLEGDIMLAQQINGFFDMSRLQ